MAEENNAKPVVAPRIEGQGGENFEFLRPLLDRDVELLFDSLALWGVNEEEVGHAMHLDILHEVQELEVGSPAHVLSIPSPIAVITRSLVSISSTFLGSNHVIGTHVIGNSSNRILRV